MDRSSALRDYADQIGLDPSFTIHDRDDSTDLMNLVEHELGLSRTKSRFPIKGTCLAIYSRCVNAELAIEEVLKTSFPWCAAWSAELRGLFAAYVEAKQRQNVLDYDDLVLYWAQTVSNPDLAADIASRTEDWALATTITVYTVAELHSLSRELIDPDEMKNVLVYNDMCEWRSLRDRIGNLGFPVAELVERWWRDQNKLLALAAACIFGRGFPRI